MESRFSFEWVKSSANSVLQTAWNVTSYMGSYLGSPVVQKEQAENAVQLVDGVSSVVERGFFREIMKAKKTREIFAKASLANLSFIGKYLIYEYGMLALRALPYVEESVALSVGVSAIDWAAYMYMVGEFGLLLEDNFFYSMALPKAARDEILKNNSTYKPCEDCGSMALVQAGAASSYYYTAHAALFASTRLIPYAGVISIPLSVYLSGRGFVEYQMVGVCTTHRSEHLANLKSFSFGVGLGLQALSYGLGALLRWGAWEVAAAAGGHYIFSTSAAFFIDYALYNLLSNYYVVVSHTIKMPKVEHKTGKDILYISREGLRGSLEASWDAILSNIPYSTEQFDCEWIKEHVENFFLNRDSARAYLEQYEDYIKGAIKEVDMRRMTPGLKEISYYNQRMSLPVSALKDNRQALRIIFDDFTGEIFSFIKNLMIARRLHDKYPRKINYLLTDDDRKIVIQELEKEIKRLKDEDAEKLDKENFSMCLRKLNVLKELYNKVDGTFSLKEIRRYLKVWKLNHADLINAHRTLLVGFFKKTETADFASELIDFAEVDVHEGDGAEAVRKNEILLKIQKRLEDQQALISYYKIDDHKAKILEELEALINDDDYAHLSFNQIYSVWKEYNESIIEAHRYVSTSVKNGLAAYFSDEYEARHTRTEKFLDHLSKQYADSSPPEEEDLFSQPVAVEVTDEEALEWKKTYYKNRINAEMKRLRLDGERDDSRKMIALKQLQQMVNRQAANFSIDQVVSQWKANGNWKHVNAHRSVTTGLFSAVSNAVGAGTQLTETAKFINELAEDKNVRTVALPPKSQSQPKR